MPEIVKERNHTKPPIRKGKDVGVWDRVADVEQVDSGGLHISLYGKGKTGKTRFISTCPKPILIVGAEDGTRSIRGIKGIQYIKLNKSEEIVELAEGAQSRGFATFAVDTGSTLQDLILKEVVGLDEIPAQMGWGTATREQYGAVTLQIKTLLKRVLDTPLHVVITAHERNFSDEVQENELLMPSVGSALSPSVCNWLNGAVDYICQTFIRRKTVVKNFKQGGKIIPKKILTDEKEYCLRIGPDPVYMTGFRLPPGCKLPDIIVNPTFDKVNEVAQGLWKPPAPPQASPAAKKPG